MIIVVMGVTGAGKTTVGTLLAHQLRWEFIDADTLHPEANVEKMRRGVPLDDDDRQPWLERLRVEIARRSADRQDLVLACSALKENYRRILAAGPEVKFVYLRGGRELVAQRVKERQGHFADDRILAGQFEDLEEPADAMVVDIAAAPDDIVKHIRKRLGID